MREPKTFLHAGLLMAALALPGLAACGSADNPTSATSSFSAKARKAHKPLHAVPGEEDLAEMVTAVSATKTGPPVDMKFRLMQRPEIGQPVELAVILVPGSPALDSVSASFQVSEGLDIVEGAQTAKVEKPAMGAPLRHMLKILPKHNGIFAITAVVAVDSANETSNRTFAIPVISGDGLPDLPAKPVPAKGL